VTEYVTTAGALFFTNSLFHKQLIERYGSGATRGASPWNAPPRYRCCFGCASYGTLLAAKSLAMATERDAKGVVGL